VFTIVKHASLLQFYQICQSFWRVRQNPNNIKDERNLLITSKTREISLLSMTSKLCFHLKQSCKGDKGVHRNSYNHKGRAGRGQEGMGGKGREGWEGRERKGWISAVTPQDVKCEWKILNVLKKQDLVFKKFSKIGWINWHFRSFVLSLPFVQTLILDGD
jgi:hypothetical protein